MTDYTPAGIAMKNRLLTACGNLGVERLCNELGELCARVEALEANAKPTPNDRQIRSSLVKQVALAICGVEYGLERDAEAVNWTMEARAAIREIAAWLSENAGSTRAVWMLEQEAKRG